MRSVKKILAIIFGLIIVISFNSPAYSAFKDINQIAVPPKTADGFWAPGYIGIDSAPAEQLFQFSSYLLKFNGAPGNWSKVTACSSFKSPECAGGDLYSARAEFQPCTSANPTDCFKDFFVKDSNGQTLQATLVTDKVAPFKQQFTGDQNVWLPNGGDPLVYSIPSAPHAAGDLYMVKPDVFMKYDPKIATNFYLTKFEAGIYPIKIVPIKSKNTDDKGNLYLTSVSVDAADYARAEIVGGQGNTECDGGLNDGKNCIFRDGFPAGLTFGMSLRLSHNMYGWLHGRINNPQVKIENNPVASSGVDLTLVGEPINVPVISGFIKTDTAPSNLVARYTPTPRLGGAYFPMGVFDRNAPLSTISVSHNHMDPSEETMAELREWLNVLGDTSTNEPSNWLVQTIIGGNNDAVQKCTNDNQELAGLVTTNATTYLPGPPIYNKSQATLDYKVMAPHFASDKSVFLGSYNLMINSKLARCIYGFSSAPIGATVSVVASDGTNRVATTVVSQDSKFLRLSANGFEFSDPTVQVKITQAEVKPTPSPTETQTLTPVSTPTPQVTNVAKSKTTTITCIKGKTTKKVTAVNPKCPSGYKKK